MTPGLAKQVTEITVDESGVNRIKGQKETDHNTIIVELNIDIPIERKKIKRWNLNNKEGWKKYNEELRTKYEQQKPKTQAKHTKNSWHENHNNRRKQRKRDRGNQRIKKNEKRK